MGSRNLSFDFFDISVQLLSGIVTFGYCNKSLFGTVLTEKPTFMYSILPIIHDSLYPIITVEPSDLPGDHVPLAASRPVLCSPQDLLPWLNWLRHREPLRRCRVGDPYQAVAKRTSLAICCCCTAVGQNQLFNNNKMITHFMMYKGWSIRDD